MVPHPVKGLKKGVPRTIKVQKIKSVIERLNSNLKSFMLNKKSRPKKELHLRVPFKIDQLVGRRNASFKDSRGKDRE